MGTKPYYKAIVQVAYCCYREIEAKMWIDYMKNKFGENIEETNIIDSEETRHEQKCT